jgi:hypothetical protein
MIDDDVDDDCCCCIVDSVLSLLANATSYSDGIR